MYGFSIIPMGFCCLWVSSAAYMLSLLLMKFLCCLRVSLLSWISSLPVSFFIVVGFSPAFSPMPTAFLCYLSFFVAYEVSLLPMSFFVANEFLVFSVLPSGFHWRPDL